MKSLPEYIFCVRLTCRL